MRKIITDSDSGAVRIGIDGLFTINTPNGYGDGSTSVLIGEAGERTPYENGFFTTVSGEKIGIFDYDCDGGEIVETLTGKYAIYVIGDEGAFLNCGAVFFEKWD